MKNFQNTCAQGDVLIRRCDSIPEDAKLLVCDGKRVVVTHSETGHDHVMALDPECGTPSVQMYHGANPLIAWLEVNRPTALEHLRPFDTHEPIMLGVGIYEVRRQREHAPEGWRQVQD